jgi:hypothetical protein
MPEMKVEENLGKKGEYYILKVQEQSASTLMPG